MAPRDPENRNHLFKWGLGLTEPPHNGYPAIVIQNSSKC